MELCSNVKNWIYTKNNFVYAVCVSSCISATVWLITLKFSLWQDRRWLL